MSTTAVTPGSAVASGPMNLDEAADAFYSMLAPEEDKPAAKEAKPALEGEDEESDDESDSQEESEDDAKEADAEEKDEEKDEEDEPELHTIKVNGEEKQVTLDDLKRGYQRNEDYTRKTMALAEQRKAAEADHQAVRSEREHYANLLGQLQQQIRAAEPQIDWNALKAADPQRWAVLKVEQAERAEALANLQAEADRVDGLKRQESEKQEQERLRSEEEKLLQALPEWKDPEKARAGKAALIKAGEAHGFTKQELSGVTDHRAVLILRKAAEYDRIMAKQANLKPDRLEPSTRPARPGAAAPKKMNGLAKANQRLANSGSVEDAADVFGHLLGV